MLLEMRRSAFLGSLPRSQGLRRYRSFSSAAVANLPTSTETVTRGNLVPPPNSTIFSGIQPTGVFHLGNYLGAVNNWVTLSRSVDDTSKLIIMVADLHAITVPKDPQELREFRMNAIASLLSVGLNPEKTIIYYQSEIPQHSELSWILSCITGMGYLNRMTQWKSKANLKESSTISDASALTNLKLGLFSYPVLQAADIILYKATHVPVGEDQSQHLELTRQITTTFNATYGDYFPVPQTVLTPTSKVLSLRNPQKKMSKSDPNKNATILLTDTEDVIAAKIRKAVTDSIQGPFYYDLETRPGVSSLISVVAGLKGTTPEEVVEEINGVANVKNHQEFKAYVTDIVIESLRGPRLDYERLVNDRAYLRKIADEGGRKAKELAEPVLDDVKKLVGL